MANPAFKLFSDPQVARGAVAALRASGYPAESIGVLVREDSEASLVANDVGTKPVRAGTMPEVGPVLVAGGEVLGLQEGTQGDVTEPLAAALGLTPAAVSTFTISLLRGSVLVAVRPVEGLPEAQRILRNAEPANVRTPKQRNEGFELADRRTTTNQNDSQFSGDFRKY